MFSETSHEIQNRGPSGPPKKDMCVSIKNFPTKQKKNPMFWTFYWLVLNTLKKVRVDEALFCDLAWWSIKSYEFNFTSLLGRNNKYQHCIKLKES